MRKMPETDETRPDRGALARVLCQAAVRSANSEDNYRVETFDHMWGLRRGEYERAADAVLALLPAPHPQGGTETLRLIVALHAIYPTSGLCGVCGTYWPCDTVMLARPGEIAARAKLAGFWEGHPELAALLDAAPAPTKTP